MSRQLVIQLARFGDIIQTGRLIRALERESEVHLCVDRSLVTLARLIYPQCVVHGVLAHGGNLAEMFTINRTAFSECASLDVDAVYNLNHSPLNRTVARLFDPEVVRGYRVAEGQPLRERWIRMAFRWMRQRRCAPLNLVDFWGLLAPRPLPPAEVNPVAVAGGKGLGVVLAGRQARRSLPPEVLAVLVQAKYEALGGVPVYLLGSASERAVGRQLMQHLPRHVLGQTVNLAGRTNWSGLLEAVQGLDCVLSPDTGTMHLAARLGVPVCGVFLSSAWAWETGAYGLGHEIWQAAPSCAPCAEAAPCTEGVRCLESFHSKALLTALAQRLASRNSTQTHDPQPNLLCLHSAFDALGQIWEAKSSGDHASDAVSACWGLDTVRDNRLALRALLGEYHGLEAQGAEVSAMQSWIAGAPDALHQESDWMLPDVLERIEL